MDGTGQRGYADHYRNSPYAGFPQDHQVGGSAGVSVFRVQQASHDFTDPPGSDLVIAAAIETDMNFSWHIGDGWTPRCKVPSRSLHILPANTEARIRAEGRQDMIFLAFPAAFQAELRDRAGFETAELVAGTTDYFHDASAVRFILAIWMACRDPSAAAVLKVDSLLLALVARLLQRGRRGVVTSRAPLSERQLRIITDAVEAKLETPLKLDELSMTLGLTRFQFARSFREKTGHSPHQYVLARRLDRARTLLKEGRLSLAEVSYACGFASQSHMTDTFRGHLGITPGAWRRQRLSDAARHGVLRRKPPSPQY